MNTKDKNLAALLAFFGGAAGLHRWYLGQKGLGVLYIFLFCITWFVGFIDAIVLLGMSQEQFDLKYNQPEYQPVSPGWNRQEQAGNERARIYAERQRQRKEQEERRRQTRYRASSPTPAPGSSPSTRRRATSSSEKMPAQRGRGGDAGAIERAAGQRYFKDFEYDRAILAFARALEKNPRDLASHFNLAAAYSAEEEADKAFYHLDRAVALGFEDHDRIRNHDAFAYLRVQPAYPAFAANGFRLAPDLRTAERELDNPIRTEDAPEAAKPVELPPINDNLLEELQRLATLREKGLLTDPEFAAHKKRLLG